MEKRNTNFQLKLSIIVGILLMLVGVSLAYFIGRSLLSWEGSSVKVTTANIKGATV